MGKHVEVPARILAEVRTEVANLQDHFGNVRDAVEVAGFGEDADVRDAQEENPCVTNIVGFIHGVAFALDMPADTLVALAMALPPPRVVQRRKRE